MEISQNEQQTKQYEQPPAFISTKDLSYINDMLAWNLLAIKKAHFVAEHCTSKELKQAFEECSDMHQRHYNQLLQQLNQSEQPLN